MDGGDEARRPPGGGGGGCYLVKLKVQKKGPSVQRIIGIWHCVLPLAGKGTARGKTFVSAGM